VATLPDRTGARRPKERTSTFTTNDFVRRETQAPAPELAPTLEALRQRRAARAQDSTGEGSDPPER